MSNTFLSTTLPSLKKSQQRKTPADDTCDASHAVPSVPPKSLKKSQQLKNPADDTKNMFHAFLSM
jgi:hypothetical protein